MFPCFSTKTSLLQAVVVDCLKHCRYLPDDCVFLIIVDPIIPINIGLQTLGFDRKEQNQLDGPLVDYFLGGSTKINIDVGC